MDFKGPLGKDIINLPAGPSVAVLSSESATWPGLGDKRARHIGGQFKGYRLNDKREPIFTYIQQGVTVNEYTAPKLAPGGSTLLRRFDLSAKAPPDGVYVLAADGADLKEVEPGVWSMNNNGSAVKVYIDADVKTVISEQDNRKLLNVTSTVA